MWNLGRWSLLGAACALAGCASVPDDWGRGEVVRLAAAQGREWPVAQHDDAHLAHALAAPLTRDTAVRLALMHNPDLRRRAARLGFAAADLHAAGRLANPRLSFSRLSGDSSAGTGVPQLGIGLAVDVLNLLLLPAQRRMARAHFEAARLEMADAVLDLAAQVEAQWTVAVAAERIARARAAAADVQQAGAMLAQRFADAGNLGARHLRLEQAAASHARLSSMSARAEADTAAQRLHRAMGLPADARWTLDLALPEPQAQGEDIAALQALAFENRMDVIALRTRAQALARHHGLTRRTRRIGHLELGVEREREFDGAINAGPSATLELPLFDWGGARHAAAQAALLQAEAELDARVLDVAEAVARAATQQRVQRLRAQEYREQLIPHLEAALALAQAEQNYMLTGVFDLIAARQQTYEAYAGYLAAVRDHAVARSELRRAVGRDLPGDDGVAPGIPDPLADATPPAPMEVPHVH